MASSEFLVNNLVILGVGLMGGSLALAAKRAGVVKTVTGWSRTQRTLDKALASGVIDRAEADFDRAISEADVVVVATPTQYAEQLMIDVLDRVGESVAVTDVASVKGNIYRRLVQHYGALPRNAVLGHPIAGSEKSGVDAAFADLYVDRRVILIADSANDTKLAAKVCALWEAVGAEVDFMTPDKHDEVLALTSHLPHFLAYALVAQLSEGDNADEALRYAGGGFRDFTRIAASDPRMWREIFLANKTQLLSSIDSFQQMVEVFEQALRSEDGDALESLFAQSKSLRDQFKF